MEDDDDAVVVADTVVNDWLETPEALPVDVPPFTAHKYTRLFALDVGAPGHDQYVYVVPNGLCVVGLAPSHAFLKQQQQQPRQPLHTAADAAMQPSSHPGECSELAPGLSANQPAAPTASAANQEASPADMQGVTTAAQQVPTPADVNHHVTAHQGVDHGTSEADGTHVTAKIGQKRKAPCPDDANGTLDQPTAQGGTKISSPAADPPVQPASDATADQTTTPAVTSAATATAATTAATATAATSTATNAVPSTEDKTGVGSSPAGRVGLTVSFDVGRRDALLKQSGKKRTQGAHLEGNAVLCVVTDGSGNSIRVRPVAGGKLLEVNQRLTDQPDLVITRPCCEGYLAILFPTDSQLAKLRETLCPCDRYLQLRGLTEQDLA